MIRLGLSKIVLVLCVGMVTTPATFAREEVRVDGSSAEAAQKSYAQMSSQLDSQRRQDLTLAIIKINLIGVNSATEVAGNPELQEFGVQRIRAVVAGMTAEEIIKYANDHANVRVEVGKKH
jgi:hypothetical protein